MEVIFEVKNSDLETMEEIRNSGCEILGEEPSNGLNGAECVTLYVALTAAAKELILKLLDKKTVSIKFCDEFGPVELVAKNNKELDKLISKYIEMHDKRLTKETVANGSN